MKIWINVPFPENEMPLLYDGIAGHEITQNIAEAEIIYGRTDPEAIKNSQSLKWIQVDTAGYEKFDVAEVRASLQERKIILTNSSSVYAEPCAQHVFAMMMALARRLPDSFKNQQEKCQWPMLELRAESYLLNGQTAVILGYGAIVRRLAALLAPFEMNLIAVRRNPTGDETIKTITESELSKLLPKAKHVINILPASGPTTNFMNADRFSMMSPDAIYYSIGRGTTTDQQALISALQTGKLAYVYLDVTTPEPLPPNHILWTFPNCYITPHTAGGHLGESERLIKLFLHNLDCFLNQQPMRDRII